ncbi:hypothetical protein SAMN05660199_03964 [Klenkia soli]|uniref:Uncharacterized protein n=1 Tax=Klenkia soli TaxID=1052260 RepID=A0A1H0SXV7_9ACTN|nr:hypothetical protein [Klenkia soli]SDP46633.1 hypothetical protein SAMN05660199_03964 [Klenkia soli]
MTELVKAQTETLSTERQGNDGPESELSPWDLVTFVGLPVLVAGAAVLLDLRAPKIDPLLSAVSILFGLLLGLLVLVFDQLKREAQRPSPAAGNDPLVDSWQLFVNVSWAILVSTVLLGVLITTTVITDQALPAWLTGLVGALLLHLLLTFLMILKRLFFMARRITGNLMTGRR